MFKVLIVEDEETIRKGIIFMMDWAGVNCVVVGEAADGREGIEKIAQLRPDIVVCDIRMPVMDGLAMLRESIEAYGYSAIILSGYQDFQYAQEAIRLGVREYLLKPVDFDEMKESIRGITAKMQAQQIVAGSETAQSEKLLALPDGWEAASPYDNRYVTAMLTYIQDNYRQHVSLGVLAEEMKVSSGYLNAKFKQHTQYTFNDFLNRYRISKALELMRQPDNYLKVYEIAAEVGFSDYKYFIKVFKKYVGIAPLKFLTQAQSAGSNPVAHTVRHIHR